MMENVRRAADDLTYSNNVLRQLLVQMERKIKLRDAEAIDAQLAEVNLNEAVKALQESIDEIKAVQRQQSDRLCLFFWGAVASIGYGLFRFW